MRIVCKEKVERQFASRLKKADSQEWEALMCRILSVPVHEISGVFRILGKRYWRDCTGPAWRGIQVDGELDAADDINAQRRGGKDPAPRGQQALAKTSSAPTGLVSLPSFSVDAGRRSLQKFVSHSRWAGQDTV